MRDSFQPHYNHGQAQTREEIAADAEAELSREECEKTVCAMFNGEALALEAARKFAAQAPNVVRLRSPANEDSK